MNKKKSSLFRVGLLLIILWVALLNLQGADAANKIEFKIPEGRTEFSPKTQQIKMGSQVTWINEDKRTHFLTAADPNRKEPAHVVDDLLIHHLLPPGETFQMQFDKPGTYDFFCAIHMEMRGTLTVTP
ncbi:MAG: cupredoxin domain-containing protein [Nitrospirae bacterium]|nr:cupredoxin domain-containing protein [Candidatus Manganitrophaceae bacterium]